MSNTQIFLIVLMVGSYLGYLGFLAYQFDKQNQRAKEASVAKQRLGRNLAHEAQVKAET